MSYLELSFDLDRQAPDAAEAACFDSGALAVTFSDASDDPVLEPRPGEMRLWKRTRLQALFDAQLAAPALITTLAATIGIAPERLQARAVADRVWEREWLSDFHAMQFGKRLWVAPRHETVIDPQAVVVRLDPGLAFGTGTHATTALCLSWLDGAALDDRVVIDFGCGSGVLAIAALKLGARRAYAYDIDPQALIAARENAAENQVAERLTVCEQPGALPGQCDVLLANILAGTLIDLRQTLLDQLHRGSDLLLSGILTEQEGEVTAAFRQWCHIGRFAMRDGWIALSGSKRS
jgi:ribosomal protein L11 methyltransferase